MKLSLVRVLPLVVALLVPSVALAEGQEAAPATGHKSHAGHTVKRAKAGAGKSAKKAAPKAAKKAPKAAKKAPKAAKKAAK